MTYPEPFTPFGESGFTCLKGCPSSYFYYNPVTDKMHYSLPGGTYVWPEIEGRLYQTVTIDEEYVLNISLGYFPGPAGIFIARLTIDDIKIFERTYDSDWGSSVIYGFTPGTHTIEFYFWSPYVIAYTYDGFDVDIGITDYTQLSLYPTISEVPDPVESEKTSRVTIHIDADIVGPIEDIDLNISTTGGSPNQITGITDSLGEFRFTYTAPRILSTQIETISVIATKIGYIGRTGSDIITIIPTLIPALYVSISKCPEQVDSGKTSQITVRVADDKNIPVTDSNIELFVTGGNLSQINGTTDINGILKIIYTAPEVSMAQTYTISAITYKEGYTGTVVGFIDIIVNPIL